GCVPCCIRSIPAPFLLVRLSDHLVREDEEVRRQRQAEFLGRLEVNDQRKLHGLLHREVGWRGAFQNLIHQGGGTATHVWPAEPIGHEAASVHKFPDGIDRWEPVPLRKVYGPRGVVGEGSVRYHDERFGTATAGGGKGAFKVVGGPREHVQLDTQRLGGALGL